MDKLKVAVIGATGYAGEELVRLLSRHPHAEIVAVSSVSYEGKLLSAVYPSLCGVCDLVLGKSEGVEEGCDVVFASLPHGLSESAAAECAAKNVVFIDLGADFRLDEKDYRQWYGKDFEFPALHSESVYCIPELNRADLDGARVVGNPGCYPTAATLALAPLAASGKGDMRDVVIDAKSGVTGAGRGLGDNTHFPNCNEAFSPYKIACHRHTPEIERNLSRLGGVAARVTFVPHLLPLNRGIIATCYCASSVTAVEQLYDMYCEFYKGERFVRVRPLGEVANLAYVRESNYCDISVHFDERTGKAVIVSAIDNMVKGAAGQAIQNMNIIFGLDEADGLDYVPSAF